MEPTERTPLASRCFDYVVFVAGVAAACFAAARVATEGLVGPAPLWACVPLIVLIARFPMLLDGIEVGFDSAVLMFLLCVADPFEAVAIWTAGVVLTQLLADKRWSARRFNIGVGALGGAVAALTMTVVRGSDRGTPRELLAVAIAAALYFVADLVVSAVSLALEERTSLLRELAQPGVVVAVGCVVPFDSLGYLGAVISRWTSWWTLILLAVPLATLLVATTAVTRGREHARRLSVLFGAAVRMQSALDLSVVLSELRDAARQLLRLKTVEVRSEPPGEHEVGALLRDGREDFWVVAPKRRRATSTASADQAGLEAIVAVSVDALARVRLTESMTHLARHDALTDLPNRALLLERLREALERSRRRGAKVALLFCDLDGFKPVNDRFGHACGDQVLVKVGGILADTVRRTDTVARIGGDEFAILLEGVRVTDVDSTCERLLAALGAGVEVAGHQVPLGASIGVAFGRSASTAEELLRNADMAMYQAKALGKNRYLTYDPSMGTIQVERLELLESLREAITARELRVVYQPVVEATSGRIIGVEALARWSLGGRAVPPDDFIRVAEDSGLIVPLGDLVLDLVAADAASLVEAAGGPINIAVNVSADQLRHPEFVDTVRAALERMGDATLILEITERRDIEDDPTCLTTMKRLAEAGVVFAVDDFGVGYSVISALKSAPIRIVKIDASLAADIDTDERACRLLASITLMGKSLGLDVIVEGIERDDQLAHLRQHVDPGYAQGFHLHRPMPLEEAVEALRLRNRGPREDDLASAG